jgi:carbon storage regulator
VLILQRKKDQDVVIELETGELIEVMVTNIRDDKVKLGFTASEKIIVHRREIYEAIQREKPLREQAEKEEAQREQDRADYGLPSESREPGKSAVKVGG